MISSTDPKTSPGRRLELSLVVPLFNEEENVVDLQREVAGALKGLRYELILVDDGSRDETVARILADEHVRVIRFSQNRGQSSAMMAGILAAEAPLIALMDGDLQNNPSDIPHLMEALKNNADLACGYRAKRKDTLFKRLQSRIANRVRRTFTHDGVRDTGCTLKVMRRECRGALVEFRGMHRFIPALIGSAGFVVVERAVDHRPRQHGVSKYGFGNRAFRAALDLIGVCWLISRRKGLSLKDKEC